MSSSNSQPEALPAPLKDKKRGRPPLCWWFRSPKGCSRGDTCPYAHIAPKAETVVTETVNKPAVSTATPDDDEFVLIEGSQPDQAPPVAAPAPAGSNPAPQMDQPKAPRKPATGVSYNRPFKRYKYPWNRKRIGAFAYQRAQEQTTPQSVIAKAEKERKVTIYSEDEEQTWTLDRAFLSKHSESLRLILAYGGKQADSGIKDPIKGFKGMIRFGDGSGRLQLDDVKTDDFDTFLGVLRAPEDEERPVGELKVALMLASDWGFDNLRNRTFRKLKKLHLPPMERAQLARRCKITKWIRGALLSLPILLDPPSGADIQILGTTTAAAIWRAREGLLIHQLEALATEDTPAQSARCRSATCKQVLRAVMVRKLEKSKIVVKSEAMVAPILAAKISEEEKAELCPVCASDDGLAAVAKAVAEEVQVVKTILEESLGKEDVEWLEPA
ncbi:hypothetical protein FRB90_012182 [Tulasnella sp. 427]|nr:hypothetical protein FRB90_012182 [Tulasnella sp. 427]